MSEEKKKRQRSTTRRIGSERSKSRAAILAGAMTVLGEQGAAALTASEIARAAGVKPPLVHYYFRSMDDLVLALVRGLATEGVEAMAATREVADPVRSIWALERSSTIGAAVRELAALAYHLDDGRGEIMRAVTEMRRLQSEAIARAYAARGTECPIPPVAVPIILGAVARALESERNYGVLLGHEEAVAAVEAMLARFSPAVPKENTGR